MGPTRGSLSTTQAADLLGVHRSTVYRAVRRGELVPDAVTPSGALRFLPKTVEAYRLRRGRYISAVGPEIRQRPPRLPDLHAAALTIACQTDVGTVLRSIADVSRDLVRCSYSLLRLLDESGSEAGCIASGVPGQDHELMEELTRRSRLPDGVDLAKGPFRLMVRDVSHSTGGSRRSWRPMNGLLAVAIRGNSRGGCELYLTGKWEEGEAQFTEEDEWLVGILSEYAGIAIENARLHNELRRNLASSQTDRRHLQAIVDALSEYIVVYSGPDGRVELLNRAAREAAEEWLPLGEPRRPGNLLLPNGEPCPEEETPYWRVVHGGEGIVQRELLLRRSDGRIVPILATATTLPALDSSFARVLTTWQDITSLKEAERLKDEFLSLVSHELRRPLTSIKGVVSGLLTEDVDWGPSERREFMMTVEREVDRLSNLVSNLLDAARLEAGGVDPEREPFALADLVEDLRHRLTVVTEEHALHTDVPAELPEVLGDYEQVGRVLTNLLANAVEYSPPGAAIHLSSEVTAGSREVFVGVTSEGPGIPSEDLPRLFERFYRGRQGLQSRRAGSGLGLWICRRIVEAHGGQIWAESSSGRGLTVRFTLPLAEKRNH